jgi:nitric oxide reductase subunit B
MTKTYWWLPILAVVIIGLTGVFLMGIRTYQDAPPIPTFVDARGQVVISQSDVLKGQVLFQKYALMDYGSMFGDGASRGPDFTADALHQVASAMNEFYLKGDQQRLEADSAQAKVKREIKENRYDSTTEKVVLTDSQVYAVKQLVQHYQRFFNGSGSLAFQPAGYIKSAQDITWLAAFFFWGA